jgi:hypothetical protein
MKPGIVFHDDLELKFGVNKTIFKFLDIETIPIPQRELILI